MELPIVNTLTAITISERQTMTGQSLMDTILPNIIAGFAMIPFTGSTWFILFTMLFFVGLFFWASHSQNSNVCWEDLVIETKSGKTSPYKLGYLVGIVISTWIVIKLADANNLGLDIFGAYLAYLLGGAGFNTYMKNRIGKTTDPTERS